LNLFFFNHLFLSISLVMLVSLNKMLVLPFWILWVFDKIYWLPDMKDECSNYCPLLSCPSNVLCPLLTRSVSRQPPVCWDYRHAPPCLPAHLLMSDTSPLFSVLTPLSIHSSQPFQPFAFVDFVYSKDGSSRSAEA
jgi:hypothetical protein